MLNNYCAHAIDKALYLAGSYAEKISACMFKIASLGDADDVVKILMSTRGGIALDIEINMAAALHIPEIVIYGGRGAVMRQYSDEKGRYWLVKYFNPEEQQALAVSDALAAKDRKYMGDSRPKVWHEKEYAIDLGEAVNYYDECYKYFALGQEPFVPVADTMEVMRIMHECRKYAGWSQDE
jgi:hypothetical protein